MATTYFDDQSPYADRLTLAAAFAADDETRATAQDLRTYSRLSWAAGLFGPMLPRRWRH
jgi:hypothetical protein